MSLLDAPTPTWTSWDDLERRFFGPGLAVNTPVTGTVATE